MGNLLYGPCGLKMKKAFKGLFEIFQEKKSNPDMDIDKEIMLRCANDFNEVNICQNKYSKYYKESEDMISKAMEEGMNAAN